MLPAAGLAVLLIAVALWATLRPKATPGIAETPAAAQLAPTISTPSGNMVLVAAGQFLFGEKKEPVSLPAFYIDKTEVTNRAYAEFAKAAGHKLPDGFDTEHPDFPVVNVSILDAQAFAKWAEKRLPTAREWEKAARGADGRLYPWGNQQDLARANVGTKQIRPVSDLVAGASPFGAVNMIGNVWELVDQLSTPSAQAVATFGKLLTPAPGPDEPWYTIRGESFQEPQLVDGVIWDSTTVPARWKAANIGFRCVRDPR